jgi:mono/diheme cytochrome c family protein
MHSHIRYTHLVIHNPNHQSNLNMKTFALVLLALAIGTFTLSCSQPTQPANANGSTAQASPIASVDEFAAMKTSYAKMCKECHGASGEGGTVQIDNEQLKVPSLREGHALAHSDQQLVKQILEGGEGMPAFKDKVSTAEAAELVRFVRKEFQRK